MTNPISTLLTSLAGCLCAQIEATEGLPGTCFCGVIPGDAAVQEYAGDCNDVCGMAWVRMVTAYPSTTVGQVSEAVGNCTKGTGVDIEIGVMRCYAADVDAPTEAELLLASDLQIEDMLAMRRAIECCPELPGKDFILGSYRPMGPMGGMLGGVWTVMVGL